MRSGHGHHHDLVERLEQADAVHDTRAPKAEALRRVVDHRVDRPLGHAGVVFELHRLHPAALVPVAHRAHERGDRADRRVAGTQRGHFGTEVEVAGLDRNAGGHGFNHR